MRRFVVLGLFWFAPVFCVFAQDEFSVADSIKLEEITAFGNLRKYQSGAKIERISTKQFEIARDGNLEQLLSRILPIAFKSDAGGLSTIRIRGTSASHTSLNFGGININSLTLGHSNTSNVPLYLFDNIGVQFGSSSSVNGSGSIGGAIHLGLTNNWTRGLKAEMRVANGSFGEKLYGAKLFAGNGKFESVTRAYFYSKTNNFQFLNTSYRDFENHVFEIEDTQHNAGIENMGLLQEFNYKFAENDFFIFNIWLEKDWHLIQQNMQTNLSNPDLREEIYDDQIRVWSAYKNRKSKLKFEIGGGYVYDNSVYNNNSADTIQTNRVIGEAFLEHDFSTHASYKLGVKGISVRPVVYAYSKSLKSEDRLDFYASYYHRLFEKLTATLNLRQGFVSNFEVPFTPAIGLNYRAVSEERYVLNFTGNIARSYRVPTFNDRFWLPGGNPNLKPEKGINYELGTIWSYCSGNVSGNIKLNAFYLDVNNWILWRNGGSDWFAANVQRVISKGVEFMTDWDYLLFGLKTSSGLNYSLTSAQRVESEYPTNALFRQVEYVPLHSGNIFTTTHYKNFDFSVDASVVDKQFENEEDKNFLNACLLMRLAVSYKMKINKNNKVVVHGMIDNLLDTTYQSSWGYAMPGASYRLSLAYNFK